MEGLANLARIRPRWRNFLLLLILMLAARGVSAQAGTNDSARLSSHRQTPLDSATEAYQMAMAATTFDIESGNYGVALRSLSTAKQLLKEDTASASMAAIDKQFGVVYSKLGDFQKALMYFDKAEAYYRKNNLPQELSNLQSDIGLVFSDLGNYEVSLRNYFESLKLAETAGHEPEQAKIAFRIACVYYLLDQPEAARKFADRSLSSPSFHAHPLDEAAVVNLMGLLAAKDRQYDQALAYFQKALQIRQQNNFRLGVASTLWNIGDLLENMHRYAEAFDYYNRSKLIEEAIQHRSGLAMTFERLGRLSTKAGDYINAAAYLNQAEALSKSTQEASTLRDVYKDKRDLQRAKKDFQSAMEYDVLYESLNDSIFHQNLINRLSTLQGGFELDQKAKEIKILSQEKELQQEKLENQIRDIRQQRIIILLVVVCLVGSSAVAFVLLKYYRQVKQLNMEVMNRSEEIQTQSEELTEANAALSDLNGEIREQKEKIEAQSEALLASNQAISQINEGLEAKIQRRTSELQQAYRELDTFFYRASHDFRRPLTTFMGLAEVANITIKDESALELFDKVNQTAQNLDRMLTKLQSISDVGSQELVFKEVLIQEIFRVELANFEKEIHDLGIDASIDLHQTQPSKPYLSYPALVKVVVQNLIENAISFSRPVNPYIRLSAVVTDSGLVIEVADNGEGVEEEYQDRIFDMYFRANTRSKGNGLGLYIVRKTVVKLNGQIEFISKHNHGTTVRIHLPHPHS